MLTATMETAKVVTTNGNNNGDDNEKNNANNNGNNNGIDNGNNIHGTCPSACWHLNQALMTNELPLQILMERLWSHSWCL